MIALAGSFSMMIVAQVAISLGLRVVVVLAAMTAYLLFLAPLISDPKFFAFRVFLVLAPFLIGYVGPLVAGPVRETAGALGFPDVVWGYTFAPPLEEAVKLGGVLAMARAWSRFHQGSPRLHLLLGGALAGVGFGISETLLGYQEHLATRLLTSIPIHCTWTFLATAGIVYAFRAPRGVWPRFLPFVGLYGIASVLHASWNYALAVNVGVLLLPSPLGWAIPIALAWKILHSRKAWQEPGP